MAAGFSQENNVFYDPVVEVTLGHFHNILLVTWVHPTQCGRGPRRTCGPLGAISGLPAPWVGLISQRSLRGNPRGLCRLCSTPLWARVCKRALGMESVSGDTRACWVRGGDCGLTR